MQDHKAITNSQWMFLNSICVIYTPTFPSQRYVQAVHAVLTAQLTMFIPSYLPQPKISFTLSVLLWTVSLGTISTLHEHPSRQTFDFNPEGFTLEPCKSDEDCLYDRPCAEIGFLDGIVSCSQSEFSSCFCFPLETEPCASRKAFNNSARSAAKNEVRENACINQCSSDDDCTSGSCGNYLASSSKACVITCTNSGGCGERETCASTPIILLPSDVGVCYRRDMVKEDPSFEELVCIDAEALAHMPANELVYERHRRAKVLCDQWGSCATAGHIVRYRGVGMMMKKYCSIVGCVQRVKEVNSPRYKMGLRIPCKSEGLVYTAFAARYESFVEETMLSTAVRLGL